MFILDTNVISELRKPDRADPLVLSWAKSHDHNRYFLSVVTILEVRYGAWLIYRRDKPQGELMLRWIEQDILVGFTERILPIDAEVAMACAELNVPNKRPDRDAYIAATALVHNLTVATRNTRDFEGTGVNLLNPWIPQT